MAFVDEITIYAEAGNGGNGVVRWRHEKGKEFSGAAGGNGGKGGDVYARAVRDVQILSQYRHQKEFKAQNGEAGRNNSQHGADGEDCIIDLPIGSIIKNKQIDKTYQLEKEDQTILLLKGGRGGLGNEHFKASTNTSPEESTPGKEAERGDFYIELELVADAGLIGLPNAGKSSLLNELTNARSKVGAYAFTTLDPSLGSMEGFIIADIPGLIEGAADGKGLGHKFLRHVKRTHLLLHCISLENENLEETYKTVRTELELFDAELAAKPEVIILTKTDMTTPESIEKNKGNFEKISKHVFIASVLDDASIKDLKDQIIKLLRTL